MAKFIPETVAPKTGGSRALPRNPGQAKHPFYLMVHPREWEWVRGYGWVPSHGRLTITPGVMGVQTPASNKHSVDASPAILAAERNGWIVLKDQSAYLVRLPVQNNTHCYFTKWDAPDEYYGSVEWDHDRDGFIEFLQSLAGSEPGKMIPDCPDRLKERKISQQVKRVARLEQVSTSNPHNGGVARRYKAALEELGEMQADLSGETPKAEGALKAGRGGRKAGTASTKAPESTVDAPQAQSEASNG